MAEHHLLRDRSGRVPSTRRGETQRSHRKLEVIDQNENPRPIRGLGRVLALRLRWHESTARDAVPRAWRGPHAQPGRFHVRSVTLRFSRSVLARDVSYTQLMAMERGRAAKTVRLLLFVSVISIGTGQSISTHLSMTWWWFGHTHALSYD